MTPASFAAFIWAGVTPEAPNAHMSAAGPTPTTWRMSALGASPPLASTPNMAKTENPLSRSGPSCNRRFLPFGVCHRNHGELGSLVSEGHVRSLILGTYTRCEAHIIHCDGHDGRSGGRAARKRKADE